MLSIPPYFDTADARAVLLVGGLGTRLRATVPSSPKPLAPVGDRPFLERSIRQLASQGIQRLVMCTGYLADQIEAEFSDGRNLGVTIEYSKETRPLGTGGAVKLAEKYLQDVPEFLVLNGDSFLEVDFRRLIQFHRTHGGLATIAVVPVENAGRYGTVRVDASHRVTEFQEKTGTDSPGSINAGVYVFGPALLKRIPAGQVSLEKEVFPKLLGEGMYALQHQGLFIDIGTPSDYERAQQLFDRLRPVAPPIRGS